MKTLRTLQEAVTYAGDFLKNTGQICHIPHWQGVQAPADMFEAHDLYFRVPLPRDIWYLQGAIKCNHVWAEEHFQERISGIPYNPPPSNERWPHRQKNNDEFKADDKFSHTYPERFWPKEAGGGSRNTGIRYDLGDLNDFINQLNKDPYTRQAYLPIFFPEDTGGIDGQRVPCTLGYHFMQRSGYLHMTYIIRSCDYFRHFKDDIYMAIRLAQYVLAELKSKDTETWGNCHLGYFKMIVFNLHIFAPEEKLLYKK